MNQKRTATAKQLAALKIGHGYFVKHSTPEARSRAARAGGMALAGSIGSRGMADMAELGATAREIVNNTEEHKEQVRALGKRNVATGFLDKIRTHEGSSRGGIRQCHIRWHVERNKPNPNKCSLCREELQQANIQAETAVNSASRN